MKKTTGFVLMLGLVYTAPVIALQVLYTAEGDTISATDRLIADGAQDGTFTQTWSNNVKSASSNIYVADVMSKFGGSSLRFNQTQSYLHTIDIPDSSTLGAAFTLAAYVRPDYAPYVKTILSTYSGEAGGYNELIFGYGSGVDGIRLFINADEVNPSPAVTIPAGTYSHIAATYDNGAVKLYLNGVLVGSGTLGSGTPVIDKNDGRRIQVGEDWLWGSSHNEQTVGYMDDLLIYDRALSSNEIAGVAYYGAEVFLSGHLIHPGILYTAEGDTTNATDKLISDRSQDGVFSSTNVTVRTSNPKFGARAFNFPLVDNGILDTIELPGTKDLGERFTLAAYVNSTSLSKQRLFTSYKGGGGVSAQVLIFEFDPDGVPEGFTMRLYHNETLTEATAAFSIGAYHHLALTYDNGAAKLYLDGIEVGSGTHPAGPVLMTYDLRVGEDWGSIRNEPLIGDVDDIVVLRKALSPSEILLLMEKGGQKFLAPPVPPPLGTVILVK